MDPELLKRPSSSFAGLYPRRIRKDLPPAHILTHNRHGRLHPPVHQHRRRTFRTELDRRHAPRRARGASHPSFRWQWAVHYQWRDVLPLVEGHGALEGGQA